eukprot:280221_1
MSFKFRKNKYYVEKLLPIKLPNNKYIAISFKFNESSGRTQTSAVCLDLCDMYNKASLVTNLNTNNDAMKWLTMNNNDNMSINNLVIGDYNDLNDHYHDIDEIKEFTAEINENINIILDESTDDEHLILPPPPPQTILASTPSLPLSSVTNTNSFTLPPQTALPLSSVPNTNSFTLPPQSALTSMPSLDSVKSCPINMLLPYVPSKVTNNTPIPQYYQSAAIPTSYTSASNNNVHLLSAQSPMITPTTTPYQQHQQQPTWIQPVPLQLNLQSIPMYYNNQQTSTYHHHYTTPPTTPITTPTVAAATTPTCTLPPFPSSVSPATAVGCQQLLYPTNIYYQQQPQQQHLYNNAQYY